VAHKEAKEAEKTGLRKKDGVVSWRIKAEARNALGSDDNATRADNLWLVENLIVSYACAMPE
jgi:hypothetical protein